MNNKIDLRDLYQSETGKSTMEPVKDFPRHTIEYVDWLENKICNINSDDKRYFLVSYNVNGNNSGLAALISEKGYVRKTSIDKHINKHFGSTNYSIISIMELSEWDYKDFLYESTKE